MHHDGDDALPEDVDAGRLHGLTPRNCPISIFAPVDAQQFDIRQAIRMTWGKSAVSLGMKVFL